MAVPAGGGPTRRRRACQEGEESAISCAVPLAKVALVLAGMAPAPFEVLRQDWGMQTLESRTHILLHRWGVVLKAACLRVSGKGPPALARRLPAIIYIAVELPRTRAVWYTSLVPKINVFASGTRSGTRPTPTIRYPDPWCEPSLIEPAGAITSAEAKS